jgi:hypothetical protein
VIFRRHLAGLFHQSTDPAPDRLFEMITAERGIIADGMTIKPASVGSNTAIIIEYVAGPP